jgi:hypothetical protein
MNRRQQNILTINGKTYDATTGLPVKASTVSPAATPPVTGAHISRTLADISPHHKKSFDGFIQQARKAPAEPKQSPLTKSVAAHSIHRTPQKAQTLYRGAFKERPQAQYKPKIQTHHASDITASRLHRSMVAPKHSDVRRFAPQPTVTPTTSAQPTQPSDIHRSRALDQLAKKFDGVPSRPPVQHAHMDGPALKKELIRKQLAEIDEPIKEVDIRLARQEHRVKQFFAKQPRLLTAATGALAVLIFVGYLVYLNIPNISMRIAAERAGFAATMPAYKPTGYSLTGPVAYSTGEVQLKFASTAQPGNFTLTQHQSNWDAQALLQDYVSRQTNNYMTYQDEGLTIYMFNGQATWINGGIWYSVSGSAGLSSDQILNLATSM